jgi:alpha-galactosidase
MGAVVETNALFRRDAVRPVMAGCLPPDIRSLVMPHALNQETVLKAALARDKKLAFHAFLSDPLLRIPRESAHELFDRMLANTKAYLPGWDI